MRQRLAFTGILMKDIYSYYLKPPNISWGMLFPLAWAAMFFYRSGASGVEVGIEQLLPGVMAVSILFGTTSMLAVAMTFERKSGSMDRLLVAPISLELLLLAKTSGAIIFGALNAMVPVLLAAVTVGLPGISLPMVLTAVLLTSITSAFLGLLVAVSVTEVFEAQTLSNFFRFPMLFVCGLFIPIGDLPVFLRPISYAIPLTYGVDLLFEAVSGAGRLPVPLSLAFLSLSAGALFVFSIMMVRRRWIV